MIAPIQTDEDHRAALTRIEELWNAEPGTPEFAELDALATLIGVYEERRYPIPDISPAEILRYMVTDGGRSKVELAQILGSKSRASEILTGRRELTLDQIRNISAAWHLPVSLLVGPAKEPRKDGQLRKGKRASLAVARKRKSASVA